MEVVPNDENKFTDQYEGDPSRDEDNVMADLNENEEDEDVQIVLNTETVEKGTPGATFARGKSFNRMPSGNTPGGVTLSFSKPPQPTGFGNSAASQAPGQQVNQVQMNSQLAQLLFPVSISIGQPILPGGHKTILDIDIDTLEEKPWRKPGITYL